MRDGELHETVIVRDHDLDVLHGASNGMRFKKQSVEP